MPATLWRCAEYLNVNVAPYVAPLLLAAWLHAELRAQIFSWEAGTAPAPAVGTAIDEDKQKRGRYRAKK